MSAVLDGCGSSIHSCLHGHRLLEQALCRKVPSCDDIKSQIWATIVNRILTICPQARGETGHSTADWRTRTSEYAATSSLAPEDIEKQAGPASSASMKAQDGSRTQRIRAMVRTEVCYIRMEGKTFGNFRSAWLSWRLGCAQIGRVESMQALRQDCAGPWNRWRANGPSANT